MYTIDLKVPAMTDFTLDSMGVRSLSTQVCMDQFTMGDVMEGRILVMYLEIGRDYVLVRFSHDPDENRDRGYQPDVLVDDRRASEVLYKYHCDSRKVSMQDWMNLVCQLLAGHLSTSEYTYKVRFNWVYCNYKGLQYDYESDESKIMLQDYLNHFHKVYVQGE
jgi:hypothetical protein